MFVQSFDYVAFTMNVLQIMCVDSSCLTHVNDSSTFTHKIENKSINLLPVDNMPVKIF